MSIDCTIFETAEPQRGLVTTAQLVARGVPRQAISHRVAVGLLRRLFTGVYQVGPNAAPHARELAALLACGGGAVSHASAAAVLQILPGGSAREPVHVTRPSGCPGGHVRRGIRVHRRALRAEEVLCFDGCSVTTPVRTLLDLAELVGPRDLERAFARAERADPTLRARLAAELPRRRGRRGIRRLGVLLEQPAQFVRSDAEAGLLALVARSGLPAPQTNVLLHGFEVDCVWREQRLVIEVDGARYHGSRRAVSRDHDRDATLLAAGFRVLRLGASQLRDQPERVIALVAQSLARGG